MYKKAHLISDFRKKISPQLGFEPTKMINSCDALFRMLVSYGELVVVVEIISQKMSQIL